MTRKDYEMIAKVFNEYQHDCFDENKPTVRALARLLAVRLERDNPKFNRDRFLAACGVK